MHISNIKVENFRTFTSINIDFDKTITYLIGENNLGKSNLLDLMYTITNGWSFQETDYKNEDCLIIVNLTINLHDDEIGLLGDNFDPIDSGKVNLTYSQSIADINPTLINTNTFEPVNPKVLRKITYIKYDSATSNVNELRFDKQKGTGALLRHIISKFTDSESCFLDNSTIEDLLNSVNDNLSKIKSFNDFGIVASISDNPSEIINRLISLNDMNNLPINTAGSGVQHLATATINIVNKILELYKSKTSSFEDIIITNSEGKKLLPLILAVDEPEIHLHPYMQRSLINYYKNILSNCDDKFIELLQFCFGIDGLVGQLIIVTHSSAILIDDYRHLVRIFNSENDIKAISGSSLNINDALEKHLIMHFPDIKEAFYSKCVILIEGTTEFGAMRYFAEKLNINLDDFGISFIDANGEHTITKLKTLFDLFGIKCIMIYDGDVKLGQTPNANEFFTTEICFEMEIIQSLISTNKHNVLEQILFSVDSRLTNQPLDQKFVKSGLAKLGITFENYTPKSLQDIADNTSEEYKSLYFACFYKKKGYLLGRHIGRYLTVDAIPNSYKNALLYAKEIALNA